MKSILTALAAIVAMCFACVPPTNASPSPDCGARTAAFIAAFGDLPRQFTSKPICPTDVGPGLSDPELRAQFSTLATADVTDEWISPAPGQDNQLLLGALVGTLKSGSGEDFVDALLTRLGPEAAQGTVTLVGHRVHYLNLLPGGPRGYAYGEGKTVVIGYVRPPIEDPINDISAALARYAFDYVLEAATGTPPGPDAGPPVDNVDQWPPARGKYTTTGDVGWTYFRTPGIKTPGDVYYSCGIGPEGIVAGCDHVPDDAPPGTNQTIVDASGARYVYSDTPTFTRDVDSLRAGERLESGPAVCGVNFQGPVACRIGDHRFSIGFGHGYLE